MEIKMVIKILVITERKINTLAFKEIWDFFDNSWLFKPKKYDFKEPVKKKFSKEKYIEAYGLLDKYLIIEGDNDFLLMVNYSPYGTITWKCTIDLTVMGDKEMQEILNFVYILHKSSKVIFGRGATEAEYNAKHLKRLVFEDGGRAYGWKGTSVWNFYDYLPGIYWLNIFGKELSESLNRENLLNLQNVEYIKKENNLIIFHLKDLFLSENTEERELDIRNQLGKKYFFDINETGENFSHPESFKKYLEKLENQES
jgi:hypothetical protein